jgi:hypothetical protein
VSSAGAKQKQRQRRSRDKSGEEKAGAKIKAAIQVASSFGLRSGLRQSGVRASREGFYVRAEALTYHKSKSESKNESESKGKGRSRLLRFAAE